MDSFGTLPSGETVHRVTLASDRLRVGVLTWGATLQTIETPDAAGQAGNVALGFATLPEYLRNGGHYGAVPGRYAGRIAQGRFTIDGVQHQATLNRPPNTIHGGKAGFGKRNWTVADLGPRHVTLTLLSPDGDEGFPGTVQVRVTYTLDGGDLRIDYGAETDRPTIINLTNHSYFNLGGEGSGDILGHRVTIPSGRFLPTGADGIPTGEILPVDDTPFDFRTPHPIGERIRVAHPQLLAGLGYDHSYLLPGEGLRPAAHALDPVSRRTLSVLTTMPALHFYTGGNIPGTYAGRSNRIYRPGDGVCFEAQAPQDAPNHPGFPSTELRPGRPFTATTIFRFGIASA